jgi:hypothetical protein
LLCKQRFAPTCQQSLTVEVFRMQGPDTHYFFS